MVIHARTHNNASNSLQIWIHLKYTFCTRDVSTSVEVWRRWWGGADLSFNLSYGVIFYEHHQDPWARATPRCYWVYKQIPFSSTSLHLSPMLSAIWVEVESVHADPHEMTHILCVSSSAPNGAEGGINAAPLSSRIQRALHIIHHTYTHHAIITYLYFRRYRPHVVPRLQMRTPQSGGPSGGRKRGIGKC